MNDKALFRDTYEFLTRYTDKPKMLAADWQECTEELSSLNKKHKGLFASRMLVITFCHIVAVQEKKGKTEED